MSKHHGLSKTRLYKIWQNMKARCYKEYDHKYKYYGRKGIKICDEWLNDFKCFYDWAMQNGYTEEMTIDRIDSSKDYCPENCRWVTMIENLVHSFGMTYDEWEAGQMAEKTKYSSQIKNLRKNYVRFPLDLKPDMLEHFKTACKKNKTTPTTEIKKFISKYCEENK